MIRTFANRPSCAAGFSLPEMMISVTLLGVVMTAAITGTTAITGSMVAAENYSVGQLATVDYLTLDLRRANSDFMPTTDGTKLTLPLTLTLPQYYKADGRTPSPGQKTLVTDANRRAKKKKHRVVSARFYYHYGALDGRVNVQYYLSNGSLFRQEGALPAREIGQGIKEVTFTSPSVAANATAAERLAAIAINPVVTSSVEFLPTRRSKVAPPPLSNSTFLREYYYSDY